jgi:hypothetical protein
MFFERIERGVRNLKENETYTPTLSKLGDSVREGANDLKNKIGVRIQNFRNHSNKLFRKIIK